MDCQKTFDFIKKFYQSICDQIDLLNDLDNEIGDGDHGSNLKRGLDSFMQTYDDKSYNNIYEIFKDLGMNLLAKTGGASGPLYGFAFISIGDSNQILETPLLFEVALSKIKTLGKSEFGQKTMIDVWQPCVEQLKQGSLTYKKIDEFVENTKQIVALKGRASYLKERSLGHIDPGAYSTGLMFKALISIL